MFMTPRISCKPISYSIATLPVSHFTRQQGQDAISATFNSSWKSWLFFYSIWQWKGWWFHFTIFSHFVFVIMHPRLRDCNAIGVLVVLAQYWKQMQIIAKCFLANWLGKKIVHLFLFLNSNMGNQWSLKINAHRKKAENEPRNKARLHTKQ
jgi:hypothetical protein